MNRWRAYYDDGNYIFYKEGIELDYSTGGNIIVDALNAAEVRIAELERSIAELKLENERLQDAWFVDETIMPDGSLRPPVSKLTERLEKAEAEIAELKPYRDGYDPEKDFPPEGENVIATHNNWLFLAQRRGDEWYDSLGAQAEIRGGVDRWWKLPEVEE